jgi:hypothetical protein
MVGVRKSFYSHAQVSILDIRGHVDTALVEQGVEKSTYLADYDDYLEGHIPVSDEQQHFTSSLTLGTFLYVICTCYVRCVPSSQHTRQ